MARSFERLEVIFKAVEQHGEVEAARIMGMKPATVNRRIRDYKRALREMGIEVNPPKREPRILLFDIENSPNLAWIWSLWQEVRDAKFIEAEWYMLCYAYKWLGGETKCHALPEFDGYDPHKPNDKPLLQTLWELLNEADVVVAHNAVKFDIRKVNARFLCNDMPPPSPYKVVDTLKVARSKCFFTSNRLNDLCDMFGFGRKVDTGGFELWKGCMSGDKDAWAKMIEYNIQDVDLLESLYLKLRPYMNNHPTFSTYDDTIRRVCQHCGGAIEQDGYAYTPVGKYVRYKCFACGTWGRDATNLLEKEKRQSMVRNIA